MNESKSQSEGLDVQRQVLVVEDNENVRDLLKRLVANLGYQAVEARRAKDALAHLEKKRMDLMLLDLQMPGGSGLDLLRVLRKRKIEVPTVVVSAYISVAIAQQLADLGVRGIVAKPFKMERIIDEVQNILLEENVAAHSSHQCPECSTPVDPDDNFCKKCGHNLEKHST